MDINPHDNFHLVYRTNPVTIGALVAWSHGMDRMLSVSITINVVSSNTAQGDVYSIKHSQNTPGFLHNKTERHHDITELFLKVALNTKTQTPKHITKP
jgi:hypothetical protein